MKCSPANKKCGVLSSTRPLPPEPSDRRFMTGAATTIPNNALRLQLNSYGEDSVEARALENSSNGHSTVSSIAWNNVVGVEINKTK